MKYNRTMTKEQSGSPKPLKKSRSLDTSNVHFKTGVAFFLMALIPILLMLYMVFFHMKPVTGEGYRIDLQLLIFLALCSALVGYLIIRKIASAIATMAKSARDLAEGKALPAEINVKEQSEEIRNLIKVFSGVNQNLEKQVAELEESRRVIQDLLKKIGAVITSEDRTEGFFDLIVDSMVKAMDAETGALLLRGEEGEEKYFRIVVTCGKEAEAVKRLAAQRASVLLWMSGEKHSAIINRSEQPREEEPDPSELPYRSLLCVPLRYQNRGQGCVMVLNRRNGKPFTQEDAGLLEHVASQIAVAAENSRLMVNAERSYVETVAALAVAVEERDSYTHGHLERVARCAVKIGEAMKMNEKDIQTLRDAAFLYDIGKIAIEDKVLLKKEKLTPEEQVIMRSHAEKGEKIIAPLRTFKDLREIVRHHQEWFDGSGYPDGISGEAISLSARILSVADVYDALITARPYRKALPKEEAVRMIEAEAGSHFDPKIVRIFLELVRNGEI